MTAIKAFRRAFATRGTGVASRIGIALLLPASVLGPTRADETLHSNPGAPRVVYLDFNGHVEPNPASRALAYGRLTPFDTQGNPDAIRDIWARVAEDFAPMDVDVTTEAPPNMGPGFFWTAPDGSTRSGLRIVIHGGDALDGDGKSYGDTLDYNTVYVDQFTSSGGRNDARKLAQVSSHEAGHAFSFTTSDLSVGSFGLSHYRLPRHNSLVFTHHKTQLMGTHADVRDIWWTDPAVEVLDLNGNTVLRQQEDLLSLLPVCGFRADDHGDVIAQASPLRVVAENGNDTLGGLGIISMNTRSFPSSCAPWGDPAHPMCSYHRRAQREPHLKEDLDFFRFRAANAGIFEIEVRTINDRVPNATMANLDAELEVWRKLTDGSWVQLGSNVVLVLHGPSDLFAHVRVTESSSRGGEYAVAVKSAGEYGDLGQYTITAKGSIVRAITQSLRLDEAGDAGTVFIPVTFFEPEQHWIDISTKRGGRLVIDPRFSSRSSVTDFVLELFDGNLHRIGGLKPGEESVSVEIAPDGVLLVRAGGSKIDATLAFTLTATSGTDDDKEIPSKDGKTMP